MHTTSLTRRHRVSTALVCVNRKCGHTSVKNLRRGALSAGMKVTQTRQCIVTPHASTRAAAAHTDSCSHLHHTALTPFFSTLLALPQCNAVPCYKCEVEMCYC